MFAADFEELDKNADPETVAWLSGCKNLRILAFTKFFRAADLITPALSEKSIHLTSLEFEGPVKHAKLFFTALANQTSLQSLWLRGEVDESKLEVDILVESLSKLVNLRDLRLRDLPHSFSDRHIIQLASSLPELEVWSTNGFKLTDAIWGEVASLRSLRRLELGNSMNFTPDRILDFINTLGAGNKGLILSLKDADMKGELLLAEQECIQKMIAERIEGRAEFPSYRCDY